MSMELVLSYITKEGAEDGDKNSRVIFIAYRKRKNGISKRKNKCRRK